MSARLREFLANEDALTSVEYALLLALLVLVGLALWQALGQSVPNKVTLVSNTLGR